MANSLAALKSGCDSIDACARGYGAGAGNLCLEALVALLERDGHQTGLDLKRLIELSGLIEKQFTSSLPVVDSLSAATGYYGLFSGFKSKILEAGTSYNVDPMDIIASLGQDQVIAGQEDQIIATASVIAKENLR